MRAFITRRAVLKSFIFTAVIFTAVFAGLPGFGLSQAEVLYLDDTVDAFVSGVVREVGRETITMEVEGKLVKVDLDDIDLDGHISDYLAEGMTVTVQGEFDDDEIEARKLILSHNRINGRLGTQIITEEDLD